MTTLSTAATMPGPARKSALVLRALMGEGSAMMMHAHVDFHPRIELE
jgi:hypothetical protein